MNPISRPHRLRRSGRRRSSSSLRRIRDDDAAGAPPIPSPVVDSTSVRRLAAALWKMQTGYESDLFQTSYDGTSINNLANTKNDIFFKLEACAKLPNTDLEKINKWDCSPLNFSSKPSKFYKIPNRPPENSPSLKTHKEMYLKIDSIKQNLNLERENRLKIEKINSKLLDELKEAKSSIKKYFKSYEKERKAREQIEEICEDLAKEIEQEKDRVETLKIDSLRIREELEEERRMLQMAEVWREERVQLKLIDAKITLENKYSELNHLQGKIEGFLKTHSADVAAVRKAETLIRATKGSLNNINTVNLLEGSIKGSCESSQGSVRSVNGVFKENNWDENNKYYKNEGENEDEISEVCSSVTKQSRNNKGSSSNISKIWSNKGNGKTSGADLQKKKRRSGLKGRIVGLKKEVFNGGIIGENGFVF